MKGSSHKDNNKNNKDNRDIERSNARKDMASFAKKVGDFFSTEPQKEKVLSHEDFNAAGDVYYASVSAHYKVAQRILLLFLVFFLVISIVTNLSEITYDNFYYLIRDFTSAADAGNNTYETLSYESDSRQHFVLYRGGIATVSPSKLSVFTATGRRTLNETSDYSSPFAISSDKYVMFYDTSGTEFAIYNSFARVYHEELPNSVKCASLADDGSFAVVTKSDTGYWSTRIYTKNFDLKATIPTGDYVFGIDLDSDREKLAILSYGAGNGAGVTTVTIYDLSKMKDSKGNDITIEEKMTYDGEFPIKCGFMSDKTFALITDSHVRVFNKDFDKKDTSYDYSGGNITGFFLSEEGVAVSLIRSSSSSILAYDGSGNLIYDKNIHHNVSDINVCDSYLFVQTERSVIRINTKNDQEQTLVSGQGKMLTYNDKTALICGESKAEYLVFNN